MSKAATFLKKHYDLIPLLAAVTFSSTLGITFLVRSAIKNPDVSWERKSNPEPWNRIKQNQRFKFLDGQVYDYSKAKFPEGRPCMDNDKYTGI